MGVVFRNGKRMKAMRSAVFAEGAAKAQLLPELGDIHHRRQRPRAR